MEFQRQSPPLFRPCLFLLRAMRLLRARLGQIGNSFLSNPPESNLKTHLTRGERSSTPPPGQYLHQWSFFRSESFLTGLGMMGDDGRWHEFDGGSYCTRPLPHCDQQLQEPPSNSCHDLRWIGEDPTSLKLQRTSCAWRLSLLSIHAEMR